jgi:hypothetical protein
VLVVADRLEFIGGLASQLRRPCAGNVSKRPFFLGFSIRDCEGRQFFQKGEGRVDPRDFKRKESREEEEWIVKTKG